MAEWIALGYTAAKVVVGGGIVAGFFTYSKSYFASQSKPPNVSKRQRIEEGNFLDVVLQHKHVVVLIGAGCSVASGYRSFRRGDEIILDSDEIFNIDVFRKEPKLLLQEIKPYLRGVAKPTKTHELLTCLAKKFHNIERLYTQNIDGLESKAGFPRDKLIQLHGNLLSAYCSKCTESYGIEDFKKQVLNDEIPLCKKCPFNCPVRPSVVLFGETLNPGLKPYVVEDFLNCDLMLVLGTSLSVAPANTLVNKIGENIPLVLINDTPIEGIDWSLFIEADIEKFSESLLDQIQKRVCPV